MATVAEPRERERDGGGEGGAGVDRGEPGCHG